MHIRVPPSPGFGFRDLGHVVAGCDASAAVETEVGRFVVQVEAVGVGGQFLWVGHIAASVEHAEEFLFGDLRAFGDFGPPWFGLFL